jgi:DNA adenine methylase
MKTAIKYFGSKWRIADWIASRMPPHACYVEVFGGSAAVLLSKPRSNVEVYNDIDGDVVDFFRVLREHPAEIASAVACTPFARQEHELSFAPTDNPVERARRFLIRSWQTRGGYRRTGKSSWWYQIGDARSNSPATTWSRLPTRLLVVAERLAGVHIECGDWRDIFRRYDASRTLFYLDPPYLPQTRKAKWEYQHEMSAAEHEDLLRAAAELRGAVLLSGYRHPMYDELGWPVVTTKSYAQTGERREECLWCSRPSSLQLSMVEVE